MNKNDRKRKYLFDKYSKNLKLLNNNNKIPARIDLSKGGYICPICEGNFNKEDLNQEVDNALSLEDAPPKSLGGKQIVLTCENCNNGLGRDIDWHLTERLNELDFKDKLPGAEQNGTMSINNITVNAIIKVEDNGETRAYFPDKINKPEDLKKYIDYIQANRPCVPTWMKKPSRVDNKKLQIALLKNAYLLMFEKFGYALLFNNQYNRVREQLLNPEKDTYPLNCWFNQSFPKEYFGVPFIIENGIESIFTIFELKTKLSTRAFGVVLPLGNTEAEKVIEKLGEKFEGNDNGITLDMANYNDDYLGNIESINMLLNYISKLK